VLWGSEQLGKTWGCPLLIVLSRWVATLSHGPPFFSSRDGSWTANAHRFSQLCLLGPGLHVHFSWFNFDKSPPQRLLSPRPTTRDRVLLLGSWNTKQEGPRPKPQTSHLLSSGRMRLSPPSSFVFFTCSVLTPRAHRVTCPYRGTFKGFLHLGVSSFRVPQHLFPSCGPFFCLDVDRHNDPRADRKLDGDADLLIGSCFLLHGFRCLDRGL
jgi:hypothetical protein